MISYRLRFYFGKQNHASFDAVFARAKSFVKQEWGMLFKSSEPFKYKIDEHGRIETNNEGPCYGVDIWFEFVPNQKEK